MSYIAGILTHAEAAVLEGRGWVLEDAPEELVPEDMDLKNHVFKLVWVDSDMFDVMNGSPWDKGEDDV